MTNAETGQGMPLKDHIAQSIKNILFTRMAAVLCAKTTAQYCHI